MGSSVLRASTHFLYAVPSFWRGWARIMDFGGTLTDYNISLTPEQADYLALQSDWFVIGGDIMDAYQRELEAAALSGAETA